MNLLVLLQMVASLVVLAEALNKLERADLFGDGRGPLARLLAAAWLLRPWAWRRQRVVTVLKVLGWAALSVGVAGDMLAAPTKAHLAFVGGFALLILRSRLKEGQRS